MRAITFAALLTPKPFPSSLLRIAASQIAQRSCYSISLRNRLEEISSLKLQQKRIFLLNQLHHSIFSVFRVCCAFHDKFLTHRATRNMKIAFRKSNSPFVLLPAVRYLSWGSFKKLSSIFILTMESTELGLADPEIRGDSGDRGLGSGAHER